MNQIFFFAALLCMAAVLGSLLIGLVTMGGSTPEANKNSNKMMRMRVIFQALAILFLMLSGASR